MAKQLLTSKNVKYTEYLIDKDPVKREEMLQRAKGCRTVPQIFIGEHHVGGFDDLKQQQELGRLDELLQD